MSEVSQVTPGGVATVPPATVLDRMLSTLESGEAEDKHCLNHECDIILECKICRNLFRVMNSFLNHKKVHCLQYVVSFTVPLPVSNKTSEDTKADKDAKTDTKADKDARTSTTTVKDAITDTATDKDAKTDTTTDKDAKTDTATDKDAKTDTATDKDAKTDTAIVNDARTDTATAKDATTDTATDKGAKTDTKTDKDLKTDTKTNKDLKTDTETKTDKDVSIKANTSPEAPGEASSGPKDSPKIDQTKKSSTEKSKGKESEKESISEKNQTKPSTPTAAKVTASVESTDTMRLRSPRKTEKSTSKKDDGSPAKKDKHTGSSKKGDSTVQKKDGSHSKKGDSSSGHKGEESPSKKRDSPKKGESSSSQKKGDTPHKKREESPQKKSDSSAKKSHSSSQKREESSRRESSRREGSAVSSKRDKKEEGSVKKGDSSSHKKDDSSKKDSHKKEDSSIPFRIGDKESSSQKKEDGSASSKKGEKDGAIPFKKGSKEPGSQKKEDGSVPFKKSEKGSSGQKKEDGSVPCKKGDSSKKDTGSGSPKKAAKSSPLKKTSSSVKKESASPVKQGDSASQKSGETPPPSKKIKLDSQSHKKTKEEPQDKGTPSSTADTPSSAPDQAANTTAATSISIPIPTASTVSDTSSASTPAIATTSAPTSTAATPGDSTPAAATQSVPTPAAATPSAPAPAAATSAPATTGVTPTPTAATPSTVTGATSTPTAAITTSNTSTSTAASSTSVTATLTDTTPIITTPPVAATITTTTTTTASKESLVDDNTKKPVLKAPEPISVENKADEPPVLTPEGKITAPTDPNSVVGQKQSDASDTLNPLIAGVLDAYQRYKDKNPPLSDASEGAEKPKTDEATTSSSTPAATDKAPSTPNELPNLTPNNAVDNKEGKVGDEKEKDKTIIDDDLDDPEGYELKNRLRCPDCNLELTNMSKLAHHMSKHLADAKGHFVCPICQKETRLESFSELILHLRDPHFLKDKQLLPMWRNLMKNCWVDEKDMSATFPVIEAVKRSERGKDSELPEKNYKCPYCKKKPKILRFFSGLIGHLRSEHGLKRCQLQKMQAKLRKTSVVEVKHKKIRKKCMLFKCSFCFKTFTRKGSIKLHVKTCRKRTESTVKDKVSVKRRGRPKTFTKIVAFKTVGKKKSISDNSVSVLGGMKVRERPNKPSIAGGDPSASTSSGVSTPKLSTGSYSASNKDSNSADQNYSVSSNLIQPVKLETFWVSKTPGKPSECIKSTVTNLEKLRTTPSKMFVSSELSKIGNFQCYSCNRYYSFRQHFERHVQLCNHNRKIEEISDFQTLRCLECNQPFSYLQHLKRHAAKHLGLDRFKCKICNYSTYYWSDTKYHLASHKGVNLKQPEHYIISLSDIEPTENCNVDSPSQRDISPSPRTVVKRVAETSPLTSVATAAASSGSGGGSSGTGLIKTLVLTEQDGMLKVVSDPNQIAKMVNQQGTPPLKRLRISADASQAPAIIKALPDIQKAVLSPGLKIEKRGESTLMTKNLPSPTLSDPTPTSEVFEPAVDPDKEHISWVRKPLKDPDAQPFQWDDDEDDGEATSENKTTPPVNAAATSTSSTTSTTTSTSTSVATEQNSCVTNEKSDNDGLDSGPSSNTKSISEKASKTTNSKAGPESENFSEPPVLTKEVPIVKGESDKEKDSLQMPRISVSDINISGTSTSQDSLVTLVLNENNELLLISPEDSTTSSNSKSAPTSSPSKVAHVSSPSVKSTPASSKSTHVISPSAKGTHIISPSSKSYRASSSSKPEGVSTKDFFSVSHPSSSSSTSTSPFRSPVPSPKLMNKPKTLWDLQHKNTLRRLPNRGLVSTSTLSFPSASHRVIKSSNPPPIIRRSPTTPSSSSTSSSSSSSSSSMTTSPEKISVTKSLSPKTSISKSPSPSTSSSTKPSTKESGN